VKRIYWLLIGLAVAGFVGYRAYVGPLDRPEPEPLVIRELTPDIRLAWLRVAREALAENLTAPHGMVRFERYWSADVDFVPVSSVGVSCNLVEGVSIYEVGPGEFRGDIVIFDTDRDEDLGKLWNYGDDAKVDALMDEICELAIVALRSLAAFPGTPLDTSTE
jgi:hypothetical protein